ncbi:MAG: sensor histidine kinase [Vicinamibacterales bacterium]
MKAERLSIRATLAIGVLVTLALWAYTSYTFSHRLDDIERQASTVAARYLRAQDLLTTVRTQVLVASVRVRDALLNPDPTALAGYRAQVLQAYATLDQALKAYEPVLGSEGEKGAMVRLRGEVDNFRTTALEALREPVNPSPAQVRELLDHVVPRREAAVRISEETQSLNRAAFLQQQVEFAEIHRTAFRQTVLRLTASIVSTVAVLAVAWFYAGRLERRLHRQVDTGLRLSRELQGATVKLMEAQEAQRRTIARELHDEVGQALTAVKSEIAVARRETAGSAGSERALTEAEAIVTRTMRSVRDLTQLLHPSALDDLGLAAAADVLLRGLARRHDMTVRLDSRGLEDRLDADTERAAYRIVQEALTNVARHAAATRCEVALHRTTDALVLDVKDDGRGFELSSGFPRQPGVGLIGIRERVAQLCGTWWLDSRPGSGTHLHVELPLAASPPHSYGVAHG